MAKWICSDGSGARETIEAPTAEAAAQEYADSGEWDTTGGTVWIHVGIVPVDAPEDPRSVTITIHPPEPKCTAAEHDWRSPHSVVGGLHENPGVVGHGGGVVITEVCAHCGAYRITDTWAQDRETGEEGLRSVAYRQPDELSERWVAKDA